MESDFSWNTVVELGSKIIYLQLGYNEDLDDNYDVGFMIIYDPTVTPKTFTFKTLFTPVLDYNNLPDRP